MKRNHLIQLFAAAALSAMVLSGCGGADAKDAAGTGTTAAGEAAGDEAPDSAQGAETGAEEGEWTGTAMPEITPFEEVFKSFTAVDTEGNEVTQEVFADYDLTMINVWGTFCGPCLNEMPDLGQLNREYQEAGKSFQIVGMVIDAFRVDEEGNIAVDDSMVETAKDLIAQTGADYLHIVPAGGFAYSLVISGEVQAVPVTIFVDSQGNIVDRPIAGSRSKENWQTIIDEKLEQTGNE